VRAELDVPRRDASLSRVPPRRRASALHGRRWQGGAVDRADGPSRADGRLGHRVSDVTGGVVAIVPARGGSKAIPRKNVRLLGGVPLIAYSIEAGLTARTVDRVIVSTDDEEIAAVARRFGAEVPFMRPAALAGDSTPDLPVFQHALDWLDAHEGYRPEIVVQLRPTSPLRPPDCVDA